MAMVIPGAQALTSDWSRFEESEVRLVSARSSVGDAGVLDIGLQVTLKDGWKIYWRSPGDAGVPPVLDWQASDNLEKAEMAWPVPHRFSLFGLETFGYSHEVVFPISVSLADPGEALRLRADLSFLVCEEICIPRQTKLALDIPRGPGDPSLQSILIETFQGLVPGSGAERGLSLETVSLRGDNEKPVLEILARADPAFSSPDAIVEGPPQFSFAKPEVKLSADGREARFRVAVARGKSAGVIEGKEITLTVTDGSRGLEQETIARFAPGFGPAGSGAFGSGTSGPSLLTMLLYAFLGGLILNLMPCVLPVLSMKLLSLVKARGREAREVRIGFLAAASGIVTSILLLALAILAVKAAGHSVGWGLQFQQPVFLSFMAVVVTLFGLNLFGLFEVQLPGVVGDQVSRAASVAQQTGSGQGSGSGTGAGFGSLRSHFLTGALAALLATPCSAPILGTAVGFALSRGSGEILSIFALLGLGLAFPYILVALFPAIAGVLPKPGAWMVWVKKILALALFGTALWLISVLIAQIGLPGGILVAAGLLLMAAAMAVRRHRPGLRGPAGLLTGLLALAAVGVPMVLAQVPSSSPADAHWEDFDRTNLARLVAQNRLVLVDVTADWCLTCQVNERLVLSREEVKARFEALEVVAMRGDWTLPDEDISRFLADHGRYGIPFNAIYGPGAPEGLVLPELLTRDALFKALDEAARRAPEPALTAGDS